MLDSTPAVVFVLMLIAPCAIALWGDKKKKAKQHAELEGRTARKAIATPKSDSVPVFASPESAPPPVIPVARTQPSARPQTSRNYTQGRDPYELTARLYAQPASSFVETYAESVSEQDPTEALLAQAAAAKAAKEADVMADQEAARAMAVSAAVDMPATPRKPADTDTPGTAEAWQVQVASLGTEEKANQLVAKLRKKGYHASARASGQYWKVTVGPELAKDMADSMRQKLASDPGLKLSGWVQPYRP